MLVLIFTTLLHLSYQAYDESLADKLWQMNGASYCRDSKVESWDCGYLCQKYPSPSDIRVFYNSTGSNAGFSAYDPQSQSILIVMRGTVPWDIQNWIENLHFLKVNYPFCDNNCQIHPGFYDAFKNIKSQVIDHYKQLKAKYPNAKLTVTGHSLGGAMATHAVVFFQTQGVKVDQFYTFGSPRVGDEAFSTWFDSKVYTGLSARLTHGMDPVPHLAPANFGFQHIRQEIFYYWSVSRGYKVCNDADGEDSKCANQYWVDFDIKAHNSYMDYDIQIPLLLCQ